MGSRHGQTDFLAAEQFRIRGDILAGDGGIEQQIALLGRGGHAEADIAAAARKTGQDLADLFAQRERADAQAAGLLCAFRDFAAGIFFRLQDLPGITQQNITLFGAAQPLAGALEQDDPQFTLQMMDRFGNGGLRDIELLRGAGHVFLFRGGRKLFQLI